MTLSSANQGRAIWAAIEKYGIEPGPMTPAAVPAEALKFPLQGWLVPCRACLSRPDDEDNPTSGAAWIINLRRSDWADPIDGGYRLYAVFAGQCPRCLTIYWSILDAGMTITAD